MSTTPEIAVLYFEEGRKGPGDVIAFHTPIGRQQDSPVFPPRGTGIEAGKWYRMRIIPLGRNDARGNPMFRSQPASNATEETWEEFPDGQIQCVAITTNWKLEEIKRKVVEDPRQPRVRDRQNAGVRTVQTHSISWERTAALP